jgi:hypothetical protein
MIVTRLKLADLRAMEAAEFSFRADVTVITRGGG